MATRSTTCGLCRAPRRAEEPPEPDADPLGGTSWGKGPPPCQGQGPHQSPQPLGGADSLCRAPRSGHGQQCCGTRAAQPCRGPQELLWFWPRVECPSGRHDVERAANGLVVGPQSAPLVEHLLTSLCGPWWQKPDRPQPVPALGDDTWA